MTLYTQMFVVFSRLLLKIFLLCTYGIFATGASWSSRTIAHTDTTNATTLPGMKKGLHQCTQTVFMIVHVFFFSKTFLIICSINYVFSSFFSVVYVIFSCMRKKKQHPKSYRWYWKQFPLFWGIIFEVFHSIHLLLCISKWSLHCCATLLMANLFWHFELVRGEFDLRLHTMNNVSYVKWENAIIAIIACIVLKHLMPLSFCAWYDNLL